MILMIDNYDSFTYNVYQYIGSLYPQIQVVRNDEITIDEIRNLQNLEALVISPGPGYPDSAGISKEAIKTFGKVIPVLGICLGHQIISLAYGAKTYKLKFGHRGGNHPVKNLETGKIEMTSQNHSYAVDPASIESTELEITHINLLDKTVEGVECKADKVFSVQYHPESAPGPQDSHYLFDKFLENMKGAKQDAQAH